GEKEDEKQRACHPPSSPLPLFPLSPSLALSSLDIIRRVAYAGAVSSARETYKPLRGEKFFVSSVKRCSILASFVLDCSGL
ncbi:MAG TPA: hypothetical protein VF064_01890, partial [Pyrinomonadaceae bacterium]